MLRKELNLFTYKDLLEFYPLRHVDKTKVDKIASLTYSTDYAQVAGILTDMELLGDKRSKRLVAHIKDDTGMVELVWFQGISWVQKILQVGQQYLVFGKLSFFQNKPQLAHPEIENYTADNATGKSHLEPIYPSTEKLKAKGLNGRQLGKLTLTLLSLIQEKDIPDNLPDSVLQSLKFISRYQAVTRFLRTVKRCRFFLAWPADAARLQVAFPALDEDCAAF